jgi:transcriptional regulator with XRE-family HTH domain
MTKNKKGNIGKKIKKAMQEAELTPAELAKKLGVSPQQISNLIREKNTPKLSTLEKIAVATGKKLGYFLDASINNSGNNISGDNNKNINQHQHINHHKENADFELLKKDVELLKKEVENINLKLQLKTIDHVRN